MKLYQETEAHRGGRPARKGDDVRLFTKMSYKGRMLGGIGLYAVIDKDGNDIGVRVIWDDLKGFNDDTRTVIIDTTKGERQKGGEWSKLSEHEKRRRLNAAQDDIFDNF